jgi:hypothetical protein
MLRKMMVRVTYADFTGRPLLSQGQQNQEDGFKDDNAGINRAADTEPPRSPQVKAIMQNYGIKLTIYGAIWKG